MPTKHNPGLHDFVLRLMKDEKPGKLLDVPSGPGYFSQAAEKQGHKAVAAEIDESLHVFKDVTYKKVNMSRKFPFKAKDFDYIVSIEGIEHTENQYLFLRECSRALKKGGKLFLTMPCSSSLENRLQYLITGFLEHPPKVIRDDTPNLFMEHINLMPFQRLETFLRFSGFEIQSLHAGAWRKGSLLLLPFIYPFTWVKYRNYFHRYYKGKPNEEYYWKIYKQNMNLKVICGKPHIIVAKKIAEPRTDD